jgi:hypothetical protein
MPAQPALHPHTRRSPPTDPHSQRGAAATRAEVAQGLTGGRGAVQAALTSRGKPAAIGNGVVSKRSTRVREEQWQDAFETMMPWLIGDYGVCQVAGPHPVLPQDSRPQEGIVRHFGMTPPAYTPGPRLPASARDSPLPSEPALQLANALFSRTPTGPALKPLQHTH